MGTEPRLLKHWPADEPPPHPQRWDDHDDGEQILFRKGGVVLRRVGHEYHLTRETDDGIVDVHLPNGPSVSVSLIHVHPHLPWTATVSQCRSLSADERDLVGPSVADEFHWVEDTLRVALDPTRELSPTSASTYIVIDH